LVVIEAAQMAVLRWKIVAPCCNSKRLKLRRLKLPALRMIVT
jgi:hypothetical protein